MQIANIKLFLGAVMIFFTRVSLGMIEENAEEYRASTFAPCPGFPTLQHLMPAGSTPTAFDIHVYQKLAQLFEGSSVPPEKEDFKALRMAQQLGRPVETCEELCQYKHLIQRRGALDLSNLETTQQAFQASLQSSLKAEKDGDIHKAAVPDGGGKKRRKE